MSYIVTDGVSSSVYENQTTGTRNGVIDESARIAPRQALVILVTKPLDRCKRKHCYATKLADASAGLFMLVVFTD